MIRPYARSFKERKIVKTHHTKLCFGGTSNSISLDLKNTNSNNNEIPIYELGCFPNYAIRNNKIEYETKKPLGDIYNSEKLVLIPKYQWQLEDTQFKMNFNSVGQLIVIYIDIYTKSIDLSTGTGFLMRDKYAQTIVVSALHTLTCFESCKKICFISLGEDDLSNQIEQFLIQNQNLYKEEPQIIQNKLEQTLKIKLYPLIVDTNFLEFRKKYIQDQTNHQIFLDPCCHLKPSPILDICIFEMETKTQSLGLEPLLAANKLDKNEQIVLPQFSMNNISLDLRNEEYCETLERNKILNFLKYLHVNKFLNENKSISVPHM